MSQCECVCLWDAINVSRTRCCPRRFEFSRPLPFPVKQLVVYRLLICATRARDDAPITTRYANVDAKRMCTRNECAAKRSARVRGYAHARVRHVKLKVKLPSTRG